MKRAELRAELAEIIERLRKHQRISFLEACLQIVDTAKSINRDHYNSK